MPLAAGTADAGEIRKPHHGWPTSRAGGFVSGLRPPRLRALPLKRRTAVKASAPSRLARLGVFGFDAVEPVILAALVTEDPLLLIGPSGTGKTYLLNTL